MSAGSRGDAGPPGIISGAGIRLTNSSPGYLLRCAWHALAVAFLSLLLCGCASGPVPNTNPSAQIPASTANSNSCRAAQSPPPGVATQANYRKVLLTAHTANNNKPVPKLTAADLTLYQGNKQLQIAFFQPQPATVGVLVDTSGSMEEKLAVCRTAITAFVNDLDPRDDVFLFAFSDRPYLLAPFSTNHTELINNLSMLHAYGRTAIYDTIADGLTMLSRGCYSTKALLVITDGMDTASHASLDETAAAASKAKVPIYSIGIGDPNARVGSFLTFTTTDREAVDTKALSTFANDTGGQTFLVTLADQGGALKRTANAIAATINGQYIVGFVGDGSTNQLRFESPNHKELKLKVIPQA